MLRHTLSVGAMVIAFGLLAAAPHSEAAADPRAFVNTLGDQGIETLGSAPQARLARFRELFQDDFDVAGIGRFAIGRYWQALSPDQQQEFLGLFREYTAKVYADKLGQYSGARFQVTGSEPSADGVVVHSQIIRTNGNPVQLDWHLTGKDGQYKVSDVYVDQVSMKMSQRDAFAKIIQNNGGQPTALLAVLREELRGQGTTPPMPAR